MEQSVEKKKGHLCSEETKIKIGNANRGKHPSIEARGKMSDAKRGIVPWNKGKPFMGGGKTSYVWKTSF
jgi:hypothetical protein